MNKKVINSMEISLLLLIIFSAYKIWNYHQANVNFEKTHTDLNAKYHETRTSQASKSTETNKETSEAVKH